MNSPGFETSLEHKMPVLLNKTAMNGEHAGPPCGLTSLLPGMACRGRAAAFARDLHTRLRSLGGGGAGDGEATWLAATTPPHSAHQAPHAHPAHPAPAPAASPSDHDTLYDFDLECESPSSPVEEFGAPFSDRSPTDDQDPPFYDLDSTDIHDLKDKAKKNGFRFSTEFFDVSPIQLQPAPRENGHAPASGDKQLYSPITFEGCARKSSRDETDCAAPRAPAELPPPASSSTSSTSDSEFETAKSDPSEVSIYFPDDSIDQGKTQDPASDDILEDATEAVENLSIADAELYNIDEAKSTVAAEDTLVNGFADAKQNSAVEDNVVENGLIENTPVANASENESLEIITSAAPDEKEVSPAPDVDETLLSAENNKEDNNLDIDDERPRRLRRCSSLKTGKTPPGTPGRKKIVRFADVLGLDLADVKTFMDEVPVIPKSAYDDLKGCEMGSSPTQPARAPPRLGGLTLAPLFQVPRDLTDTLERLNVCLESARVGDGLHVNVCGSVRVRNLDFHKTVHVRYTMNRWKAYTDLQASYVSGSCDGFSDRFQFVLYVPCITSGQRLELAVRFQCKGRQFWDNNSGVNYCFDCLALGAGGVPGAPPPLSGPLHPQVDWHPSFY